MPTKPNQSKAALLKQWNNVPENIERAQGLLSSTANIGDSIESRLQNVMLGGGSDILNGRMGLSSYWPAQGDGVQIGLGDQNSDRFAGATNYGPNVTSTKAAWTRIKVCRDIYDNDGQIASIVDLMADFASEGITFVHKAKSVEKFFQGWQDQVQLNERFRRGIIDMIISGALFWYRVYADLEPSDVNALKAYSVGTKIGDSLVCETESGKESIIEPTIQYDSTVAMLFDDAEDIKAKIKEFVIAKAKNNKIKVNKVKPITPDVENKSRHIPWKYISLNPLQMFPNSTGNWSYLLTKADLKSLTDKLNVSFNEDSNTIEINLPTGISGKITKIKDPNKSGFAAEMQLDSDRLIYIPLAKYDWSKWATPMLWKAVPTILFKNTLRSMELKTAQTAINTVTLWKIGDHKEGLLPDAGHFERLADMLKAPSQTLNILWTSAIDAQVIQPKLDQVFDTKRWEEIRKEVTAQFGITQAVTTGEGGNFSSSYISVQGLIQKLETLRELMLNFWLQPEVKLISKAMDFRKMPKILFGNMSLRDEKAEKQLILNLLDRGYISDETAMEYIGLNVDVERRRILDQNKFDDTNDMVRRGPFMVMDGQTEIVQKTLKSQEKIADNSNKLQEKQINNDKLLNQQKIANDHKVKMEQTKMGGAVEMHMAQKGQHPKQISARQPKVPSKPNGRPTGSGKPQTNKRTPKPKNMASVDIMNFLNQIDLDAKAAVTEIENVPLYKSLSKEGKSTVLDLVAYNAAGYLFEDYVKPDKDELKKIALGGIDFSQTDEHASFMNVLNNEILEFRKTQARKPTKAELYQIYTTTLMKLNNMLNENTVEEIIEEEIQLTNAIIRKVGNKYRLYSHTGKNLGTFDSLEAAKKHEREVQYFKHQG